MKNTSKILALVLVVMTVLMSLSVLNVSAVSSTESWVVAGSSGLCNGENWAATSTKNKMTWDAANSRFVMEYTNVKAGTYEFKCVRGGSSWYPGSNVKITVKTTGSTVRIYVSGSYTVKHEIIEPACAAHNPELVNTTATCTAAGTETYSCAVCGEGFTANVAAYGHYYDENGQCIRCDKTVKLTRVYYKGSYSKPCCYTWDASGNPYVAWPGEAMKKDAEGVWYYDVPEGYTSIIFNNNGSGQTGDLATPTDPCMAMYNSGWKEYHKDTVATEDATCTETGSKVTTCSVCQRKLTEELPALGHNYVDGICSRCGHEDVCPHAETEPVPGKDATCEEAGLTEGEKCVACGEITKAQETIPALGHDWVDATFEAPKTCNNCGATEGKALVPVYFKPSKAWFADNTNEFAAYFFDNGGNNTWVKLTKASEGVYVCAVPEGFTGVIFVRLNPSIGNNELSWDYSWGQTKDLTVPTNSNNMFVLDGKEWDSGCWHPLEGHLWTKGTVTNPTCTTEGYTTYKCACGATEKRDTVPATGHDADYILKGQCGACGTYNIIVVGDNTISVNATFPLDQVGGFYQFSYISISEAGHYVFDGGLTTFVSVIFAESAPIQAFTASAWLEPGVYKIGLNFYAGAGDYALNVSKVDCTNNSVVTAPTCTEAGYTTHTCTLCGHKVVDSEVAALGHDIVVDEAVAPTCTETGLTAGQHCSRCDGATVAQEEVPSLGHDWSEGNECSRCQAPKCAHEWSETVVAPTCVKDGYTLHTCSKCGENYKDTTVPATGSHTWVETVVAPTCTEAGSKTNTCSVCEETKTEEIPALGHTFANGYCVCGAAEFVPGVHVLNVDATLAGGYKNTVVRISEAGMYRIHSNSIAIIWIYTTELSTSNPEDWPSDPNQGNWLIRSETGYAYLEPGDYIFGIYCLGFVPVGEYTLTIEAHTEHTFVEGKCACGEEDPTYVPEDPGQQPGGDEPSEPSDPSDDPSDEPTTPVPQLSVWDKIVAFLKKILAMILGFFKK